MAECLNDLCRILGRFPIFLRFVRSYACELQCAVPENIHTPPPPTEGQWKFRGGGGLKGGNFRGVGGCAYEEFLQRVRKFTKKS